VLNEAVEEFIRLLKQSPRGAVFNPWRDVDLESDIARQAPRIRRRQLQAYLTVRLRTARLAVIGEALGYRGGRFTGIPMTSERILLGRSRSIQVEAKDLLGKVRPRRTSKPQICRDGFSEPTATIVWRSLLELGLSPNKFVLWNAFPWHSFNRDCGMLSNRMPNRDECAAGLPLLKALLDLFPFEQVVALGQVAAAQLEKIDILMGCVRHPASGGAKLFREQIARMVRSRND